MDPKGDQKEHLEEMNKTYETGKELKNGRRETFLEHFPKSWLEIYANLQSPKTPKNISDRVPYRFVTTSYNNKVLNSIILYFEAKATIRL
ncbi:hypothetical protein TNCV_1339611 [Trichonephila clavipes]|uniref:Uncharacterized protein n=1 Tax=Trichonephila clavipes TaxID=2585209 RepID=A0A8X6RGY5_TRICX|nr:hypothetical protein TNCV_1339611 [Trichonephila clavipes]